MINDINDIKNILETQETKARNKKELETELFKNMFNFVKSYKGYTNGALLYLGIAENKEKFANITAKNQEEFNYLIYNYDKIYSKIKKYFEIDAKQELQEKQSQQEEKEPFTIFGVHWALVVFLFPVALLMIAFDDLK